MRKRTYLRVQVAALCLIVGLIPVGVMAITPAGTQIQATSTATYFATDGRQMPTSTSNTVVTTVGQGCGVTISPTSGSKSADPGSTADFALAVTNAGNVSDTLDLTAASAGSWTVAIYKDDNGDGIRQSAETTVVSNTGVLAAGGTAKCLVAVTVPGSEGAASDTVTFTAKSRLDASKTTAATLTVYKNSGTPTTGAYIQKWLVNGEYANTDSNTRLSRDYLGGESTVSPLEGMVSGGKTWFAASTTTEILDLGALFGGATYCAGYTAAYVYSPSAQTVQMWMGSDDGIKVWLNGAVVWENNVGRACVLEQDKTTVSLKTGWNKLVAKIAQGRGSWQVAVKLCDSTGQAISGLVYDTKPAAAGDTTAPVISNLVVTPATTSCVLTWTTNEPSSTLADYGATSALGQSKTDTAMTTSHSMTLTGLAENTTYYVKIGSSDAAGNTAWEGPTTFKTTAASTPPPSTSPYIQTWLLNGYYTAAVAVRMTTDYLGGESSVAPLEGQTTGGRTWTKAGTGGHAFDLAAAWGNPTGCAAYMHAYVYSPTAQTVNMWMGSDDGIKVWLNGAAVWTNDVYRGYLTDQDKVQVSLNQGWNRLLVKVTQGGGGWTASVRIGDASGSAIPGVLFDVKPGDGTPTPPPADTTAPVISNAVATPSTTSCVLEWETDEPATTLVNYGITSDLGETMNAAAFVTRHSVTLTGLTEGTTYYVNIGATDDAGNTGWYGVRTFTTTTSPPPDPKPTTGAYIQKWLVNGEYANTDSNTRLSSDYLGGESTVSPLEGGVSGGKTWFAASTTTEILDLGALFGGATYCAGYTAAYVYSPSAQTVQMWMGSDDGIKVWLNGAVVWENNVGRACVLEQDKTTVSLNQGWNKLVVKIAQGRGSWQVAVKLCDSTGQAISGLVYDTQPGGSTPPPADTTAPTISNVAATPGDTTCLFEWDTDEPASSLLEYGTSSALGENYMDPDLATHHSITLTDLAPGVTYYVNLGSADAAGNVAWYGTRTVTTTSSGAEAPAPAASAYIQDWLVAGYWTASSSIRMSLDYIGGESGAAPKAGEVSGGKVWTKIHTSGTVLDLGYIFRYPTGCAAYAYTNVYSPTAQFAQLWMGSDDGMKVWVNGKVVWTKDTWRSMVPDQDKVPIQLSQGWNRLLVKVTNGGSGWMTTVKVCDSTGRQLPGVAYVP